MSRAWLSAHTPQLFTAWRQAQNAQPAAATRPKRSSRSPPRQKASADKTPSENPDATQRARLHADPVGRNHSVRSGHLRQPRTATDAELWTEIANVPDAMRRTLDVTDADNTITSIIDLDGDGHRQRPRARHQRRQHRQHAARLVRLGRLADSIDTRLAEGPDWPALAAALDRAAAGGYDVAARPPRLADQDATPARHPAQELQYRLIADIDAALVSAGDASAASSDSGPGQGTRPPDLTPPSAAPGEAPAR